MLLESVIKQMVKIAQMLSLIKNIFSKTVALHRINIALIIGKVITLSLL